MMAFKSGLVIGLGAGYVLGAKSGRERYEQIVAAFNDVVNRPDVQDLVAKGKGLMDQVNNAARSRG